MTTALLRYTTSGDTIRKEVSLLAGTLLERSHTPLSTWFWAAYLVASQTPGMSAVRAT